MGVFEKLAGINVNEHTEKKEGLTYLTWSWAWDEVKRLYPEASYTIWKNEKGLPYVYDDLTGFMVYTSVTIEGVTHEMWLPVMDGKNKAMKATAYTYKTKYGDKTVEPATMFDINKTIMRCLVKNLAMFGLGLYIYAGEDLPTVEEDQKRTGKPAKDQMLEYIARHQMSEESILKICGFYKVMSLEFITEQMAQNYIENMKKKGININE